MSLAAIFEDDEVDLFSSLILASARIISLRKADPSSAAVRADAAEIYHVLAEADRVLELLAAVGALEPATLARVAAFSHLVLSTLTGEKSPATAYRAAVAKSDEILLMSTGSYELYCA